MWSEVSLEHTEACKYHGSVLSSTMSPSPHIPSCPLTLHYYSFRYSQFLQYFAPSVGKAWDPQGGAAARGGGGNAAKNTRHTSRRNSTAAAAAASGASRRRRASQTAQGGNTRPARTESRTTQGNVGSTHVPATAGGEGGGEGGDGGRSGRGGGDSSDDVRRLTQVVQQLLSEKAQMARENELLQANYDKGALLKTSSIDVH